MLRPHNTLGANMCCTCHESKTVLTPRRVQRQNEYSSLTPSGPLFKILFSNNADRGIAHNSCAQSQIQRAWFAGWLRQLRLLLLAACDACRYCIQPSAYLYQEQLVCLEPGALGLVCGVIDMQA